MKPKLLNLVQLSKNKWLNLFKIEFKNSNGEVGDWLFFSRKEKPHVNSAADVVMIIPMIEVDGEKKLVVISEFRYPINDYVFSFPSGLIDEGETIEMTAKRELKEETGLTISKFNHITPPIYASPGVTDESCNVVFVDATGDVSYAYQEKMEEIKVHLMDHQQVKSFLNLENKIESKSWGILYYYSKLNQL